MHAVLISDTHGRHGELVLPDADLLIHAGDISGRGRVHEIEEFLAWFAACPHAHKVLVAGNHDFLFEDEPARARALVPDGVTYLEDELVEVAGLRIWGSPITPWFYDWAFNRHRGEEIAAHWARIPTGVDVLITHGPPHGILDRTTRGDHAGCEVLRRHVETDPPRLHVFGHIHEAHGVVEGAAVAPALARTIFVNASSLDVDYHPAFEPVVVNL